MIIELDIVMENISVFLAYEVKPHYFFFKSGEYFGLKALYSFIFIESSSWHQKN